MEQATTEQRATTVDESRGFYLGLDLGQAADYTALVIIERVAHRAPDPMGVLGKAAAWYREMHQRPDTYEARHVERLPLGTGYPEIVERVMGLLGRPELAGSRATLAVDATGVGRPVFEEFERAVYRSDLPRKPELLPVVITGGNSETEPNGMYGVPKRELIHRAVKYLQKGELRIAKGTGHADALVNELKSFRLKVNIATGHDTYEAWREKDHDDLVLALAIALWAAEQGDQTAVTIPLSELRRRRN